MAKGKKNKQEQPARQSYSGGKKGGLASYAPIAGAVLAVCAGLYFMSGSGNVKAIDAGNAAQVKEVIYGGQPWVVLCHDGGSTSGATSAVPSFAQAAESLERAAVKFGVMDCNKKMSSGKSIFEKFEKNWPAGFMDRPFKAFLSKNGNSPFAFPEYIENYEQLLGFVSDEFSAKSDTPSMPKNLLKCFKASTKPCAILLTKGDLKYRPKEQIAFDKLMNQFRKVTFMHINTKKVSFDAAYTGAPDEDDKWNFVVLKKLAEGHESSGIDIKGKNIKVGAATFSGKKFDQSGGAKFINECSKDDSKLDGLTEQPLVYPQGRKQDALDAIDKDKDKAASTTNEGETKAEKRKRERNRKIEKKREEQERQKREGADTLEKSDEEKAADEELKRKAASIASEKVKGSEAKDEKRTGKKGSLAQEDEDEDIELD